ncbi:helix-turn-helix domain-containing protein [uncultured Brevundimonas sp.]|uniref:helix-turn-helix domain-containing protein n=1 Tax=uncultured Brevundimonas sp. TaxID=213418 RepID=UPI002616EE99|nr:helix-turn-helix domain-containing protein [uncultured Brevundimonas sp.]
MTRITGQLVGTAVAGHFGLTMDDLCSVRRDRRVSVPRQIAMYMARQYCTHLSYPAIGRLFGGRDHTTIIHGVNAVMDRIVADREFAGVVDAVERHLQDVIGIVVKRQAEAKKQVALECHDQVTEVERNISRLYSDLSRQYQRLATLRGFSSEEAA